MEENITSAEVKVEEGFAYLESETALDLEHISEEIEDMGFEFLGEA